jgi:S-formylglutathione hydrolase FrmB
MLAAALPPALIGAIVSPGAANAAALEKADDGARVTKQAWVGKHMFDLTVATPSVPGNPKVRVIVPAGWSAKAKRTWPVVYAYQGGNNNYTSWSKDSQLPSLAATWGVIVVMPEGGKYGGYADWYNYGKGGTPKWEAFHTKEVVQLLQRNYRAGTSRASLGVSSGSEGSITYAERHKGLFRYAVSLSGVMHISNPAVETLLMTQAVGFAFDPTRIYGTPIVNQANWEAHDPYVQAAKLKGVGLYISSGTTGQPAKCDTWNASNFISGPLVGGGGEWMIGQTNIEFINKLNSLRIPATVDLYGNGWHSWCNWKPQLTKAWPLVMRAIGAKKL